MERLKLLFINVLFFKVAIAEIHIINNCVPDLSNYRLPEEKLNCQHYNIKLKLPSNLDIQNNYYVETTYYIEVFTIIDHIALHYNFQSEIDEKKTILQSFTIHPPKDVNFAIHYNYCPKAQILAIYFLNEIYPGNYTLELKTRSSLTTDNASGLSKFKYLDTSRSENKVLLRTNFFWDARKLFPCFDEPGLRATFNISVKHPRNYMVLSNTLMRERIDSGNSIWTHFHTTPLMPTYLVDIVVFDNLAFISNSDESIVMSGRKEILRQLEIAHNIAIQSWNFILETVNCTVEIPKMHHVAIPSSFLQATLNWGLYTYKESDIIHHEDIILPNEEYIRAEYIAEKLAYHLFGRTICPIWWDYMWLNEGIARFFGLYIVDKVFGEKSRTMDLFVVEEQQVLLSKDIAFQVEPVIRKIHTTDEINTLFPNIVNKKATALMRMMYHAISDEVFRNGINIYLKENQAKSATPGNFWKALKQAILSNGTDLTLDNLELENIMNNWLSVSNYPVLEINYMYQNGAISIRQYRIYTTPKDEAYAWWLPITYSTESDLNFNNTSPKFWLKPWEDSKFIHDIPYSNWVIFNLQQTGYYRVNYDKRNWGNLIEYLKSDNYKKIHPINRAQLVDDSYHLMLAKRLDSAIFLNLCEYLKHERDYISWYPMERILANMSTFFQFQESAPIKDKMSKILNDLLKDIGIEDNIYDSKFTKSLRLMLLEQLCNLGETECLKKANNKLKLFIQNGNINAVPVTWKNWIICTGNKISLSHTWDRLLDAYIYTENAEYLEYLTCSERYAIINYYLEKILSHHLAALKSDDRSRIIGMIIQKHASKDEVLDYILTNYSRIEKFVSFSIINIIIPNLYKVEHFEKITEFVKNHNFSEAEMQAHENFKKHLISNITAQSKKIWKELNMFIDLFPDKDI